MKKRLIPCVLACLMIFLVGCSGNTAKEAAQEITKTETSFPAGTVSDNSSVDNSENSPQTGDNSKIIFWSLISVISLAAICTTGLNLKKKKQSR